MVIFNMFCIVLICVVVIDISGFIDSLKSGLKWLITKGKFNGSNYRIKPIDCSFCMSFWSNVIFLLVVGKFTIPYIALALIMSCFVGFIGDSIIGLQDVLIKLNRKIYK